MHPLHPHCPPYCTTYPFLGTFKISLLYEERALAARTDGEIEKSLALYTKAGKHAWESTRVFALISDRDMEMIVRGRAEGIGRYKQRNPHMNT